MTAPLQGPATSSRVLGGSAVLRRLHDVVVRIRRVTDHPVLVHLARAGLIAYGAMHLLIAVLALRMAMGLRGADADQTGALLVVAGGPGGRLLLVAIGLGMLSLAVWQAAEVLLWWHGLLDGDHRVRTAVVCAKCLAKGAVYGVLGVTALLFALGFDYEADERLRDLTGETLAIPGGALLVGAVAAGVVAVGAYVFVRGCTGGFMRDIDLAAAPDRWEPVIEVLGRVGYLAKGVAFALVGVLLWRAATSHDVSTATGLDGAMTAIAGVGADRGCSAGSRPGSPRSGSTPSPARATPTATPPPRPSGRPRRRRPDPRRTPRPR